MKHFTYVVCLALITAASRSEAAPRADLEVDPLAYALGGTSVHVGMQFDRLRADLGAFSLDVPSEFHGNPGFGFSMAGVGAKLDYFPFAKATGFFAGIEASFVRGTIIEEDSAIAERATNITLGVRAGYRFPLGKRFFASPWIGVGYATGKDREVGGQAWKHSHLTIFPTVHLGYRF